MDRMHRFGTPLFLFVFALLAAAPAAAQEAIYGRVTDAGDGAPIAGATVAVLDEAANPLETTVTTEDGSYRLPVPGPGSYLVVVQVEGAANSISDPLTVIAGSDLSYDLSMVQQEVGRSGAATQEMDDGEFLARYMSETCAGTFVPGLHGILFGAVRNEGSGDALPFIDVSAQWDDGRGYGRQALPTRTDDTGFWYICNVPAGQRITVQAKAAEAGVDGPSIDLTVRPGTMRNVDLEIPLSQRGSSGNLIGTVRDVDTSRPIVGATVRLRGADRTTATNDRGLFIMEDVPAGLDIMEIDILGYEDIAQPIQVYGGRGQQLEVLASKQPFELDPILVTVRPRSWFSDRAGLEDRMRLGLGNFLLREDIEERQAAVNLGDMMRSVPGVRVRRTGGGLAGQYVVQLRGAANLENQACSPLIWLDGVNLGPDPTAFSDILTFDIEAIEVYKGAAQVPGEFSGSDSRCGAVVVWTRRGFGIGGTGR